MLKEEWLKINDLKINDEFDLMLPFALKEPQSNKFYKRFLHFYFSLRIIIQVRETHS